MLIGLVVGAFVFSLLAIFLKRPAMVQTARHCIVLAYLFLFPMVLLGYLDWQYYFSGAWLPAITMKIILTGIFLVLITIGIILATKSSRVQITAMIYGLCFVLLIGLGYYGGHLAFSCMNPTAPWEFEAGAKIYSFQCASCHPNGGNIITPDLPLRGARQLANYNIFLDYLRNPVRPDGSDGEMPAFSARKISDNEARELYGYIVHVLETRKVWPPRH
jgi:hypothetical protein